MASHSALVRTGNVRNIFQPKPDRFPMDGRDDLEGEKWQGDERRQQRATGQRATLPGECSRKYHAMLIGLHDSDLHLLVGRSNAEAVPRLHLHEGRDVEFLRLTLSYGTAGSSVLHRKDVGMDFAKSVADFVDQQRKIAAAAIAEVDRKRIEYVAEEPRIAQKEDAPARQIDIALFGQASHMVAQGCAVTLAVIGFVEAEDRSAIDAEQARLAIRFIKPVEVDEQVYDRISEPVGSGSHAGVHNPAQVERPRR